MFGTPRLPARYRPRRVLIDLSILKDIAALNALAWFVLAISYWGDVLEALILISRGQ